MTTFNFTMNIRSKGRSWFYVVAVLSMLALAACQPVQRVPVTQSAATVSAETPLAHANQAAVRRSYEEVASAPAASVCPTNASAAAGYQQQATKVVGYLLGGENPLRGAGCNYSACAKLAAAFSENKCVLSSAVPGNVCGLQAGLIPVECNDMASVGLADATACGAELDACFGPGVSGFFVAISHKTNDHVFELDPEPARLTQSLSGSNGATAAAVYVNSGQNTTVVRWPGSYTSGSVLPPAGMPCSTLDLPPGSDTTKVIVAYGNYRKCM